MHFIKLMMSISSIGWSHPCGSVRYPVQVSLGGVHYSKLSTLVATAVGDLVAMGQCYPYAKNRCNLNGSE
jgi:hypothetical protein